MSRDTLKTAAAVQLGFLRMSGCPLSDLKTIPLRLLRHVAAQLQVTPGSIATLRSLYERPKTCHEHQWWAWSLKISDSTRPHWCCGSAPLASQSRVRGCAKWISGSSGWWRITCSGRRNEEALVRRMLESVAGVKELEFDLPAHTHPAPDQSEASFGHERAAGRPCSRRPISSRTWIARARRN